MKRTLRWLAVSTLALAGCELAAWAVLAGSGRSVVHAAEASPAEPGASDAKETHRERVRRRRLRGERLHPYLGFMHPEVEDGLPASVAALNQPETYGPGSPLFSSDPRDLIVGITGGSVAEQFARLGGSETLAPLLVAQPRFEGRNVRFVSLAAGGAKQPHQLIALEYVLVQGGRLDVVINLDGFNEIGLHEWENERYGVAPIYPRLWRVRVERQNAAALYGELQYVRDLRAERTSTLLHSPLRTSRIRRLVWAIGDRSLEDRIADVEERIREASTSGELDFVTRGPRDPDATYAERQQTLVDIWRRASLQMDRICRAGGIDYYHFLQPNQYVRGSKPILDQEAAIALKDTQPYGRHVPTGYPLLLDGGQWLAGEGVRFHDLTRVFEERDEVLYVDTCCHVNELGNAIMARAVAAAIASWD